MKTLVRLWRVVALLIGWPLISRMKRFPYLFIIYPGSQEDIEGYFHPWAVKAARSYMPEIFPVGFIGRGIVMGTFTTADCSNIEAQKLYRAILCLVHRKNINAVALAGRMPGILIQHGLPMALPLVAGNKGTVHAVTEAVKLACKENQLGFNTTIAVIGGGGYIGRKLIEHLHALGFESLIAVDYRYQATSLEVGIIYTSDPSKLKAAAIVVVLTAEGAQIEPQLPYLQGQIIIDDTHPQMPHWLVERLQENGCKTYKMVLEVDGITFKPPLPGYRPTWIPGCVWEAIVTSKMLENGSTLPDSQQAFDAVANTLPFRILLQKHYDNVRKRQS